MNRSTWIGRLFRKDREEARRQVIRVLRRNKGHMPNSAIDIGVTRRHLLKLLWRETLWPDLDAIRAEFPRTKVTRLEREWLEKARAALKGSP